MCERDKVAMADRSVACRDSCCTLISRHIDRSDFTPTRIVLDLATLVIILNQYDRLRVMPQRNDIVNAHVVILGIQRTRAQILSYVNRVEIPPLICLGFAMFVIFDQHTATHVIVPVGLADISSTHLVIIRLDGTNNTPPETTTEYQVLSHAS